MSKMPAQKPGLSEQVVRTPWQFIEAVEKRLAIDSFDIDLAGDAENSVVNEPDNVITEEMNSLAPEVSWKAEGWSWLNPPYSNIEPWVKKATFQSLSGAKIAMLVPASVGANWWRQWVNQFAYVTYLNGRITFVGHTAPYPKDLALLLYAPFLEGGSCNWRWR